MEGTRLRILQLLQRSGNDTVDGLATTIGLAQATIRRHLDILQRGRLVAFDEVRKKTGRPEYSFYLTEDGQEALPKGYDLLLNMLVQELAAMPAEDTNGRAGSEILELVFHRLSDKVWQRYESTVGDEDLESRLSTLMGLLRQEQFSPESEVVDDILRITFELPVQVGRATKQRGLFLRFKPDRVDAGASAGPRDVYPRR